MSSSASTGPTRPGTASTGRRRARSGHRRGRGQRPRRPGERHCHAGPRGAPSSCASPWGCRHRVRVWEMRVGLVCPYSLAVPGGVQAQVLGLARVLRRLGHEARVLAPCDGPPPELFVTPLGNSIPTAANGSMAPVAPDLAGALRTIRALRDEEFDIVHVHEPLAPGPDPDRPAHAPGADGRHLPRRRRQLVVPVAEPGPRPLRRPHRRALRGVRRRPRPGPALPRRVLRGACYNGVEVDRWRLAEPLKPDGPTVFFCGRHEPRKGLEVLLAAMAVAAAHDPLLGGRQRPRHRPAAGPVRRRSPHRVARADQRRREDRPHAGRVGVLRPVARRRVLRRRADRGDGGPDADRGHRPSRLPQRGPARRRRLPRARRRPRGPGRRRCGWCSPTTTWPSGCARRAPSGPTRSRWTASPAATSGSTTMLHRSELGRQMAERVRSRRGRRRNIPST